MKTAPWIFFVLHLLLPGLGQAQIVFFEGTWQEVLQEAQKQKKGIFVDVYTTWCAPCKWLDKEVFSQASVGDFFKQHFISYKIDAEKGQGPALCKQWYVVIP
jgi:thioredoxin-related protein